jgi:hypothetical protein
MFSTRQIHLAGDLPPGVKAYHQNQEKINMGKSYSKWNGYIWMIVGLSDFVGGLLRRFVARAG